MQKRRTFLMGSLLALFGARAGLAEGQFPFTLTDDEWRARLTPAQYAVLRDDATERAFTGSLMGERTPLLAEARDGTYNCAGCGQGVYRSETKFDSRTGWPSYWDAIEGAVGTKTDRRFFMTRTEVHCANCGGHLGHIFNDGPQPTGLRHCINGLALTFTPDSTGTVEGFPVGA